MLAEQQQSEAGLLIELIHFELLAAVEVLSEVKSYCQAARALGVTQSLLKSRISTLEEHLEFHIFQKGTKQLELTPEGQAFIDAGRAFLVGSRKIKTLAQEK